MKKIVTLLLVALLVFSCVPTLAETSTLAGREIEVALNYSGTALDTMDALITQFTEETGIIVHVVTYGDDYETALKTRMASNDLPDVWSTHGWAVLRYGEYLLPLNDEAWYQYQDASILSAIQDDNGVGYCLSISESINALAYNEDVCKAAGVDPSTIRTWDDFAEACEKVKAAGYTPIIIGGGSIGLMSSLMNLIAPTFWTSDGCPYDEAEALQNGTFDWNTRGYDIINLVADWWNAGYINQDVLTLSSDESVRMLANGEGAFKIGGIEALVANARTYNPEANIRFIPVPAVNPDGKTTMLIGEGNGFGIWKESAELEASKAFLSYLARPDVASEINSVTASVSALTNVESSDQTINSMMEDNVKTYGDQICYDNIWDRKYFPSGMWSVMGTGMSFFFDDPTDDGKAACVEYWAENYASLYEESAAE